jgi:hypothetical protein
MGLQTISGGLRPYHGLTAAPAGVDLQGVRVFDALMFWRGSCVSHLNLPHYASDQALYAPLKFRAQDLRRGQARRMAQRFDIHVQCDGELKAMGFHFAV